eukprot:760868-Hanusia_phi.AAC.4
MAMLLVSNPPVHGSKGTDRKENFAVVYFFLPDIIALHVQPLTLSFSSLLLLLPLLPLLPHIILRRDVWGGELSQPQRNIRIKLKTETS